MCLVTWPNDVCAARARVVDGGGAEESDSGAYTQTGKRRDRFTQYVIYRMNQITAESRKAHWLLWFGMGG